MRSLDDAATFLRAAKAVAAAGEAGAGGRRVVRDGPPRVFGRQGGAKARQRLDVASDALLGSRGCDSSRARTAADAADAPPAAAPNAKRMARLRAETSRGAKKGKKGGARKAKGSGGGGFELEL